MTSLKENLARLPIKKIAKYSAIFSAMAPFGNATFRPLLLNREYKKKGMDADQRSVLVLQEAIGQGLNLGVHLLSFMGAWVLAKKYLKGSGVNDDAIEVIKTFAGNVGSFLGMSILSPVVGGKVLNKWMKNGAAGTADKPGQAQAPAQQQPSVSTLRHIAPERPPAAPVAQPALQTAGAFSRVYGSPVRPSLY